MRQTHSPQLRIDQTPIEEIQLDIHSRDDMVHILLGLQYIYSLTEIREQIFRYLEKMLPKKLIPAWVAPACCSGIFWYWV